MVLLAAAPATSPTDAAEWSDMLAEAKRTKEEADAKEAERQRQKEFEEHRKRVGLGMLSSRFQRFEVSVSGEQRGPDAFDRSPRAANASSKDVTYARFFPGANGGRPTTHAELQKIVAAQEGGGLQSSAGRGKFLAAKLNPEALKMCSFAPYVVPAGPPETAARIPCS